MHSNYALIKCNNLIARILFLIYWSFIRVSSVHYKSGAEGEEAVK